MADYEEDINMSDQVDDSSVEQPAGLASADHDDDMEHGGLAHAGGLDEEDDDDYGAQGQQDDDDEDEDD